MSLFIQQLKGQRKAELNYQHQSMIGTYYAHLNGAADPDGPTYRASTETFSAIFPDVHFTKGPSYTLTAELKDGVEGDLLKAFGLSFMDDEGLSVDVGDSSIMLATYLPDGRGLLYDCDLEEFAHDLDLGQVRKDCQGKDEEETLENIRDFLYDHFNENISSELSDPIFDEADQDLYFESGSEEELKALMTLFILTEPNIEEQYGLHVAVQSGTDGIESDYDPSLAEDQNYYSERLARLAELALETNVIRGWEWEYNDGARERRSGYDQSPLTIEYDIEEIVENTPARERMAARRELKKWLESKDRTIDEFDALVQSEESEESEDEDISNPVAA